MHPYETWPLNSNTIYELIWNWLEQQLMNVKVSIFILHLKLTISFLRISGFTPILCFDRGNQSVLLVKALALEPNGLGRWPERAYIRFGKEPQYILPL